MSKRVLVCGGRDFSDRWLLTQTLDAYHARVGIATIIHGAARGADSLAAKWGEGIGVGLEPYPADWAKHGRSAGPKRNEQMLREGKPDVCIAFPGGRGTADMVRRCRTSGIEVIEVA